MNAIVPRIRGRAIPRGTAWVFELLITIGPDDGNHDLTLNFGKDRPPYLTRDAAIVGLKTAAADIARIISEEVGGGLIHMTDLKSGVNHKTIEDFLK